MALLRTPRAAAPSITTSSSITVIDGDTFTARPSSGGERVRVRILGIDAPEAKSDSHPAECYAITSARAAHRLLKERTATLIADPTQVDRDTYGRLLRYVEVDGKDVGLQLVAAGAARNRPGTTAQSRNGAYAKAEFTARQREAGMWGKC